MVDLCDFRSKVRVAGQDLLRVDRDFSTETGRVEQRCDHRGPSERSSFVSKDQNVGFLSTVLVH